MDPEAFTDKQSPEVMAGFSFLMIMISAIIFLAGATAVTLCLIYIGQITPHIISYTPWSHLQ